MAIMIVGEKLVLGAYALFAGVPDEEIVEAYRGLEAQPLVGALEMPLAEALGERGSLGALRNGLPGVVADDWDLVVTCIPTVMGRLASDPLYGLASKDDDGRRAAVADVRRAVDLARETAEISGRRRIRTIEVHSAPRRGMASSEALEASLIELLQIDAAGVEFALEHCDATRPDRQPEKGFFEIEEELEVLRVIGDSRLGLSINWGRSAIEGRSAQTPPKHAAAAAKANLLSGIMFSGASDSEGPWGSAWSDSHIAPRGAGTEPTAWGASLLAEGEIRETITAASGSELRFLGVKVTAAPDSTPVAERLVVAERALEMVARAGR